MERNLPAFEFRLRTPASDIGQDILSGSSLGMACIDDLAAFVELQDIRVDRVNLLQRARLFENTRIVDAIKERVPDAAIGDPERERSERTTY